MVASENNDHIFQIERLRERESAIPEPQLNRSDMLSYGLLNVVDAFIFERTKEKSEQLAGEKITWISSQQ